MTVDPEARTIRKPSAAAETPAGERYVVGDRYEILGFLGAGGMGNVYKARDRELDEIVALKMLRPELAGAPGVLDRFRSEVKLARRVTHPNVARVFDIGDRGGEKILTMELIDGEPLSALLAREGRLSPSRVVEIASVVCAGLDAAHAAGVVHRDLKPDNVLIEKGGRVVLTDFGIARAAAWGAALSSAAFLGTPAYMAPEQIEGGVPIDARTDVYALGVMLFELCVGELPFQGETIFAIASARLLHPPPDPLHVRPDLPQDLAALVQRCMARRPDDRFPSAAAVAAELASLTLPAAIDLPARESLVPRSLSSAFPLPAEAPFAKRVAVLPFRNAGPPDHDYLADALTEDVIDTLSMVPGLRVTSRGVVMRYKGEDRDPRELGRELSVQVVVDATVRRGDAAASVGGDEAVRGALISARLISVVDGVQLWARRFERRDTELLALSADAARAIAEALAVEMAAPPSSTEADPEAMELYLRARAAYYRFFGDFAGESISLFERALARAPDDPRILAGYAMARARVLRPDAEVTHSAEVAAARAVELAPGLSDAHLAFAAVRYQAGDDEEAVRSLRRALRLAPGNAEAHDLLGRMLCETTLLSAARRHLGTALTLEPEFTLARLGLARTHELMGELDETDRLLEERPALPLFARIVSWRRDARRAAEFLPTLEGMTGPVTLVRALLELVAGSGQPPYELYDTFCDPARSTWRVVLFFTQLKAEIAAFVGDRERTLAAISRVAEGGLFDVAWVDGCPLLAGLRDDPAFLAARATIAARAARVEAAYLSKDA